ncbi:hypothetical protein ABK040_000330 [Willaertia magna]
MNITTFDQFLSSSSLTLGIPNNNVMMDNSLLNAQQFINTFHLNDNNKKLIVNISLCTEDVTLTNFRGIPHYDVLLLTDANIANYLDINFNEFHPIILFPSRVCLLNKTSTHTNSVAVNEEDDVIVNEIKQMIKDDIFKRDFSMDLFNGQLLSSLIGLGNFSDENLMKIFINSLNSNLIYNSSYYNIATQQLQLYENVTNISLTWNEIVNRLKQYYAEKEFSLENLLLFDKIKEFSKRGSVILEELLDIKEEFIDRFSKSQVNISSNSKKQFLKLIEDCSQSEMKSVDSEVLENILLYDVLLNLSDTNDRLTQTSYYKTWEQVYKIQLEENVV